MCAMCADNPNHITQDYRHQGFNGHSHRTGKGNNVAPPAREERQGHRQVIGYPGDQCVQVDHQHQEKSSGHGGRYPVSKEDRIPGHQRRKDRFRRPGPGPQGVEQAEVGNENARYLAYRTYQITESGKHVLKELRKAK